VTAGGKSNHCEEKSLPDGSNGAGVVVRFGGNLAAGGLVQNVGPGKSEETAWEKSGIIKGAAAKKPRRALPANRSVTLLIRPQAIGKNFEFRGRCYDLEALPLGAART